VHQRVRRPSQVQFIGRYSGVLPPVAFFVRAKSGTTTILYSNRPNQRDDDGSGDDIVEYLVFEPSTRRSGT
jgi:hypothetical protein